jgi:hypothetical protein
MQVAQYGLICALRSFAVCFVAPQAAGVEKGEAVAAVKANPSGMRSGRALLSSTDVGSTSPKRSERPEAEMK